jgi:Heterokaryon incompatibility protein (HET)
MPTIDALCIDQNDNNEWTEQIALMAYIYARAQKVIWLGENYANVDPAFGTIHAIAEDLIPIWKASQDKVNPVVIDLKVLAFKADKAVRNLHWDSIAELLKRAWSKSLVYSRTRKCQRGYPQVRVIEAHRSSR